jgi:hypothetical protein
LVQDPPSVSSTRFRWVARQRTEGVAVVARSAGATGHAPDLMFLALEFSGRQVTSPALCGARRVATGGGGIGTVVGTFGEPVLFGEKFSFDSIFVSILHSG